MLSAITYCLKQEIYKARDKKQNITKIGSTDTISNHQNYFKICTMCLCVSFRIMVIKRPLSVDLQENINDMCTMGKWRKNYQMNGSGSQIMINIIIIIIIITLAFI